jgi:PIN domain nuclease of toxin-antitoxin system
MLVLADTHVLIWAAEERIDRIPPGFRAILEDERNAVFMSAASFWELGIKHRLGRLRLLVDPATVATILEAVGFRHLDVTYRHAGARLQTEPATRDPFDRLLLAQCDVEDMRLMTLDRALLGLPRVLKP